MLNLGANPYPGSYSYNSYTGPRKLKRRNYPRELLECLRDTFDPGCVLYCLEYNNGKPYILVDVPLERGHPYSRFVYHKGNSHEQIAKRVLEVMIKCPKSFLPSISDTTSEKWYYW
ncbi:hypothetical protein PNOK_0584800 [Pyrrhoderma noxium]|uniref:Uncharacterized protein n=1 Tax=Pyrrhoderma noxium TaxID=2282107 RepID=A0A286UHR5_9AGAM|nr:hypothetical protein PNOK_0584800 [Pyrrhoderma noxium]